MTPKLGGVPLAKTSAGAACLVWTGIRVGVCSAVLLLTASLHAQLPATTTALIPAVGMPLTPYAFTTDFANDTFPGSISLGTPAVESPNGSDLARTVNRLDDGVGASVPLPGFSEGIADYGSLTAPTGDSPRRTAVQMGVGEHAPISRATMSSAMAVKATSSANELSVSAIAARASAVANSDSGDAEEDAAELASKQFGPVPNPDMLSPEALGGEYARSTERGMSVVPSAVAIHGRSDREEDAGRSSELSKGSGGMGATSSDTGLFAFHPSLSTALTASRANSKKHNAQGVRSSTQLRSTMTGDLRGSLSHERSLTQPKTLHQLSLPAIEVPQPRIGDVH